MTNDQQADNDGTAPFFAGWARLVQSYARQIAFGSLALVLVCLWLIAENLAINTSTTDMLDKDLPFRQHDRAMSRAFPNLSGSIVVVAESPNLAHLNDSLLDLRQRMQAEPDIFGTVFDPESDPFFRRNGLLFLSPDELSDLTDRLAGAQPSLAALAQAPNMAGLASLMDLGNLAAGETPAAFQSFWPIIAAMNEASRTKKALDWQKLIMSANSASEADGSKIYRRIFTIRPPLDHKSLSPAGKAMDRLRAMAAVYDSPEASFHLRLTGGAALENEELESVADGMGLAGIVSFVLVALVLYYAMASFRLALAMMTTLVFGLIVTATFAALALPALNLISVAFAVLFVGLSVDFGIHLIMHLRLAHLRHPGLGPAMEQAKVSVGPALSLGAMTSAIGFFAFLPTSYVGLAELGLIAGVGMGVALLANLTLLPALVYLWKPKERPIGPVPILSRLGLGRFALDHHRKVLIGTAILVVFSLGLSTKARFDFDPLNLKNQETESVSTLLDLMKNDRVHPYRIATLAKDEQDALALSKTLQALPEVRATEILSDFVPSDQGLKLDLLFDLGLIIGPSLDGAPGLSGQGGELDTKARRDATGRLMEALQTLKQHDNLSAEQNSIITDLVTALQQAASNPDDLIALERLWISKLPGRLQDLSDSLKAGSFGAEDLPSGLIDRYRSPVNGLWRVVVTPRGNMNDAAELKAFAEAVQAKAPEATGEPLIILAASEAVINAFWQAGLIAVAVITFLLLALLRSLRLTILVFAPLCVAALLTTATTVIFGLSFNFANVIVLPLLFGLGVDGAIHMVLQARKKGLGDDTPLDLQPRTVEAIDDQGNLTGQSWISLKPTPTAVIYSFLTTIGSFSSIALSAHPGTASMGVLLAIAVGFTLLTTLVLLPALIKVFGVGR